MSVRRAFISRKQFRFSDYFARKQNEIAQSFRAGNIVLFGVVYKPLQVCCLVYENCGAVVECTADCFREKCVVNSDFSALQICTGENLSVFVLVRIFISVFAADFQPAADMSFYSPQCVRYCASGNGGVCRIDFFESRIFACAMLKIENSFGSHFI